MRCKACNRVLETADWYPSLDKQEQEEDLCSRCRAEVKYADFPTKYVHQDACDEDFLQDI